MRIIGIAKGGETMDNKSIFAENLKEQMEIAGKSRRDLCEALGVSYYTITDWVNAKKYPRMDKVEMLAKYFGIQKSDLIEAKMSSEDKKKSDAITSITKALFLDDKLCAVVSLLCNAQFDESKLNSVKEFIEFQSNR